jgi:hypothetical protein
MLLLIDVGQFGLLVSLVSVSWDTCTVGQLTQSVNLAVGQSVVDQLTLHQECVVTVSLINHGKKVL